MEDCANLANMTMMGLDTGIRAIWAARGQNDDIDWPCQNRK